ncbi:hypothetical protein NEFER03_0009 [Nematocida sp. LUAm3]|nr:hypothetical protein NEFER03_0009 [Nematocida sp. LUAm3]KAI5173491.1 hypothetical protein NEFER02_0007 [Nematocida sp. LUAm2]KAI5176684.1 hypothetical protein NEFER01_0009 [Nematocida sp. LUAm1]
MKDPEEAAAQAKEEIKNISHYFSELLSCLTEKKSHQEPLKQFLLSAQGIKKYLEEASIESVPPAEDLGIGTFSIEQHLPNKDKTT